VLVLGETFQQDWYCCDRKARAACEQSFTLRQQATIEIMRRNHSIIACLRHIHIYIYGCCSSLTPVRGESHIQRNANRKVATVLTSGMKSRVLVLLFPHSVFHFCFAQCTALTVDRIEHLRRRQKWVSRFLLSLLLIRHMVCAEWSKCPGSKARCARGDTVILRLLSAG